MGVKIFILMFLVTIFIGCTENSVNSNKDSNQVIRLSISRPRATEPDNIVIKLFENDQMEPTQDYSNQWNSEKRIEFIDLVPGWYRVEAYGKMGGPDGVTILEGSSETEVLANQQASVQIKLNVLLRSIYIDNSTEDQFTINTTSKSPFWNNMPDEGAAKFQLDDGQNVNVSTLSAWGSKGLYFLFQINDNNLNEVGDAVSIIGNEWKNDALIMYLSTGLSVDEVEGDYAKSFFNSYIRVMIEVGNGTIINSRVKLERYIIDQLNTKTQDMDEEFTLQNMNSQNFKIKIIDNAGGRIVVVFINKVLIDKDINSNPKIGAMFRYRNADIIDGTNVITWKGNQIIDLGEDVGGWGNIKLVGNP